jgi:hypothetical protein
MVGKGKNLDIAIMQACYQGKFSTNWSAAMGPGVKFIGWNGLTNPFQAYMFNTVGVLDGNPSSLNSIINGLP